MALELDEFHGMFFEESFEALDDMESGLVDLDVNADAVDLDAINTIFRGAHSVKGGSGMFGFTEVTTFTHVLETVLDKVRDGVMGLSQPLVDVLLQAVDCLREMLQATQAGDTVSSPHVEEIQAQLEALLASDTAAVTPTAATSVAQNEPTESVAPASAATSSTQSQWQISFRPHLDMMATANDPLVILRELKLLGSLQLTTKFERVPTLLELEPERIFLSWDMTLSTDVDRSEIEAVFEWVEGECDLDIVEVDREQVAPDETPTVADANTAPVNPANEVKTAKPKAPAAKADASKGGGGDASSIRVGIEKVDSVIDLVGELVITQSMLSRFGEEGSTPDLEGLRQGLLQLDRNTRELQQTVMQIRMLPISFSFNRFPRLVRDISGKLQKKITLEIEGDQTELDKTVLEKISDPLVHLVRNSLDHGIEMPADRIAAGKDENGLVKLNAYHSGGNIIIEVSDDGKGLPKAKLLEKARDRGIVGPDEEISDNEIHNLIFHPGFSTADNVSEISGRGVGMDVVRRNIQDLGGNVEIESEEGKGSIFRIRLPLTLAILDGQLIRVGEEVFVISLVSIVESLQVEREAVNAIAGSAELFKLRDEYIPVVRLHEVFGIDSGGTNIEQGILMVVEANETRVGLFVDDLLGQQQVVIKSLETHFRQVDGVSGATILGDGMVALIIDVPGLIKNCAGNTGANRSAA